MLGSLARKVVRMRSSRLKRLYYTHNPAPGAYGEQLPPRFQPWQPPINSAPLYTPDAEPVNEEIPTLADPDDTKNRLSLAASIEQEEFSEELLKDFYSALILSGVDTVTQSPSVGMIAGPSNDGLRAYDRRKLVLKALEAKLERVGIMAPREPESEASSSTAIVPQVPQFRTARILDALQYATPSKRPRNRSRKALKDGTSHGGEDPLAIPKGFITEQEWSAVFEQLVDAKDGRGAEQVMIMMNEHGVKLGDKHYGKILEAHSRAGNPGEVMKIMSHMANAGMKMKTEYHNHLIRSLVTYSPSPQPDRAIDYLKDFEGIGEPLPQSSYEIVLEHLGLPSARAQPTAQSRAMARDLFTHMRFAAHPNPHKDLYTVMIKICADPNDPQPERARDLFIEMTTEGKAVEPQREEYDALIRALGSTKKDYLEGFDYLRQMIGKHQDATSIPFVDEKRTFWSKYLPGPETFKALLAGTKRAGDIERSRWILSEYLGLAWSTVGRTGAMPGPDREMMVHLFQTYAAWKPTITRSLVKVETEASSTTKSPEVEVDTEAQDLDKPRDLNAVYLEETIPDAPSSNTPQTSADALREAKAIFQRILYEQSAPEGSTLLDHPFYTVKMDAKLVNSFLSVVLVHSPSAEAAKDVWDSTWESVRAVSPNTTPNGWTYHALLDSISVGRHDATKEDKAIHWQWAKDTWPLYQKYTQEAILRSKDGSTVLASKAPDSTLTRRLKYLIGLGPRQVEQCWTSVIKAYTLSNELDAALRLVNEFTELYPPSSIKDASEGLQYSGFDVVATDQSAVSESDLPPMLLFQDVVALRQRLMMHERVDEVAYLEQKVKAYGRALIRRRNKKLSMIGVKSKSKDVSGQGFSLPMIEEKVRWSDRPPSLSRPDKRSRETFRKLADANSDFFV